MKTVSFLYFSWFDYQTPSKKIIDHSTENRFMKAGKGFYIQKNGKRKIVCNWRLYSIPNVASLFNITTHSQMSRIVTVYWQ